MKTIKERQAEAKSAQDAKKQATNKEMAAIAKLFSSPEGKHVLELLMRKAGVLRPKFGADSDPIKAAIREGEARIPLFIVECLKAGGETHLVLPL